MNYFIDTEFYERGPNYPIQLISIGIVSEDNREFYAENDQIDLNSLSPWLKENVVQHLERSKLNALTSMRPSFGEFKAFIGPHSSIGPAILKFIGLDVKPKFWGYFADYDWVIFCQLFGSMMELPNTFPHYCRDLNQEMNRLGVEKPLILGCGPIHNALSDAHWAKGLFDYLKKKGMNSF